MPSPADGQTNEVFLPYEVGNLGDFMYCVFEYSCSVAQDNEIFSYLDDQEVSVKTIIHVDFLKNLKQTAPSLSLLPSLPPDSSSSYGGTLQD